MSTTLNRRSFLRISTLAGGGLVLAFSLQGLSRLGADEIVNASSSTLPKGEFAPNAFIRIGVDGKVTLVAHKPEIGQGIKTSLPMVLAEELEVDWHDVTVVSAPLDPAFSSQIAGGSTSTPTSYLMLRKAGATARTLLTTAAAQRWSVPATECHAEKGHVLHAASGRSVAYADLAEAAAALPVPPEKSVVLKDPKDFKLIGRRIGGVDNGKVVTGQALFGIDQKVPGMLYAQFVKCPVFGGSVAEANVDELKKLPGVRDVFVIEGSKNLQGLMPGVAIVADSTWSAFSARKQLRVKWNEGAPAQENWAKFAQHAHEIGFKPGEKTLRKDGDSDQVLASSAEHLSSDSTGLHNVEASYQYPFISHANLEPQNCTAHVQADRVDIWAPTQNPQDGQHLVADILGRPRESIHITITRSGGGFGRRLMSDFIAEAAAISAKVGAPVKLTWKREDDMAHDMYRPGGFHFFRGAIDSAGKIQAWKAHFVTFGNTEGKGGNGATMGQDEFPGRFLENFQLDQTVLTCNVPMGWWRAPGSCTIAFAIQSFIDELAHASGRDPLQVRLDLLGDKEIGPPPGGHGGAPYSAARMKGVLQLAAEKGDWGKPLPKGSGRGIAFHFSHLGYFAEVAEVTVSKQGQLKVDRVVVAGDVGSEIINPSGAENQVQGSVIDGLSASWLQQLTYEDGQMKQTNFHEYPLLRMPAAPKVEIHFRKTESPVTGLGEPALPPLAPAVCNAIFAATGKRVRELPISKTDLSWS